MGEKFEEETLRYGVEKPFIERTGEGNAAMQKIMPWMNGLVLIISKMP